LENPSLIEKTPDGYRIRPAQDNDLGAVLLLLRPLVADGMLLRRTTAETAALLKTGFIAEYDSEIVGFSAVEIYSKKLAEIQCLAVKEGHRRHGLGGLLVMHCVELARQRGIMEVMAISSSDSFLQHLGFDYSLPQQKRALFYQLRSRAEIYAEIEAAENAGSDQSDEPENSP
jgi:amino-acid N-acetyltransferase